jgi:murein DD-endopeptidase MepM/ murein hydrolase activator NlpD
MISTKFINKVRFFLPAVWVLFSISAFATPPTSDTRPELYHRQQHGFNLGEQTGLFAEGMRLRLDLSVLEDITDGREFDMTRIPAYELYGGLWPSRFVRAYGNRITPPKNFIIDMTGFTMPINTRITSNFGWRGRRFHYGIDFTARTGDTIVAAFDGKVRVRDFQRGGYGNYLVIRHPNGLETVYAHLSAFLVERDEFVRSGQPIGLAGSTGRSTGPHLHFETRMMGLVINPNRLIDFVYGVAHRDEYMITSATFGRTTNRSAVPRAGSLDNVLQASVNATTGSTSNAFVAGAVQTHRVRSGDTLIAIARRHGTTARRIAELNNISVNSTLRIGQTLRLS